MTEKDAVKCLRFAGDYCWYLRIDAELYQRVTRQLLERLEQIKNHEESYPISKFGFDE